MKLLVDLGDACSRYQDEKLRNLPCKRVQCDEIWSFVYAKKKNVTPEIAEQHPGAGDAWTWTAIDADSKLIISWLVGLRDIGSARAFINDVASRLALVSSSRPTLQDVLECGGRCVLGRRGLRAASEALCGPG